MMYSFYWFGYRINEFLFSWYHIKTVPGFVATCFGLASLAFLFEYVSMLQARSTQRDTLIRQRQLRSICPTESCTMIHNDRGEPFRRSYKDEVLRLSVGMGLWLSKLLIAYILMMSVMFYNGYIFIAVIFGACSGYFIFGPTYVKIKLENQKIIQETFCVPGDLDSKALLIQDNDASTSSAADAPVPSCH